MEERQTILTPEPQEKRQVTITLSKENVTTGLVVVELVLLLVMGWQLLDIRKQLEGADLAVANTGNQPTANQPSAAPPTGPVDITINSDDHVRGNANAKVTIVEYSDFECPFCGSAFPTVEQVLAEYGDDVRLVYRHFPLSFHAQAQKAGEASECAADQDKFWEFHDTIFQNQDLLAGGVTQLKTWAKEIGLNSSQFDSCLDSGEKAERVTSDMADGSQFGVTGTPAFFVNGTKIVGAQPFGAFKQIIDAEL